MIEKMVPTLPQTSRFDDPSSGSNTTQYLPPSTPRRRIVGSSSSSEATRATLGLLPEAGHEDVVRDDVELLLRFAVHVGVAVLAEDVLDARDPHFGRDRFGGERQRRENPGEVASGARIPLFFAEDVRLEGCEVLACHARYRYRR